MKKYESSLVIADNIAEVWDFLTQFSIFGKMKVVGQEPANYRLFLNAPINFTTLGEDMEIVLDSIEAGEGEEGPSTRVTVRSQSKLRTVVMDMGKNRKNVENVIQFIREQLI